MRRRAALCLVFLLATVTLGQQPSPAPAKPDGMPPNMEMYPLGFLKKGPKWTPEKTAETAKIQEGHMAHLNAMAATGRLVVAGPVGAGSDGCSRAPADSYRRHPMGSRGARQHGPTPDARTCQMCPPAERWVVCAPAG